METLAGPLGQATLGGHDDGGGVAVRGEHKGGVHGNPRMRRKGRATRVRETSRARLQRMYLSFVLPFVKLSTAALGRRKKRSPIMTAIQAGTRYGHVNNTTAAPAAAELLSWPFGPHAAG